MTVIFNLSRTQLHMCVCVCVCVCREGGRGQSRSLYLENIIRWKKWSWQTKLLSINRNSTDLNMNRPVIATCSKTFQWYFNFVQAKCLVDYSHQNGPKVTTMWVNLVIWLGDTVGTLSGKIIHLFLEIRSWLELPSQVSSKSAMFNIHQSLQQGLPGHWL